MSEALVSTKRVHALLEDLGVHPSKALGQNFLIDTNILRIIVDAAELTDQDRVLEIGPGLGVLTGPLLDRAGSVLAVEWDHRLHAHLQATLGAHPRLELLHADIMKLDHAGLCADRIDKVVSNLPYAVGTRAIISLCEQDRPPRLVVVTVQLDVAERLIAEPNTKAYGTISILAQTRYRVRVEKIISPTCFFPPPKVRSAVVRFDLIDPPPPTPLNRRAFRVLVKHSFLHRRKQLRGILRHLPAGACGEGADPVQAMVRVGVDPSARPGTLTPRQWCDLSDALQ
jgi:16S rRNA (adenine1518-N6/adenine1519-N6)-dimethyltransferase